MTPFFLQTNTHFFLFNQPSKLSKQKWKKLKILVERNLLLTYIPDHVVWKAGNVSEDGQEGGGEPP